MVSANLDLVRSIVAGAWRNGLVERFTWSTHIDQARADAERLAEERE
jgi:hypothetical protein